MYGGATKEQIQKHPELLHRASPVTPCEEQLGAGGELILEGPVAYPVTCAPLWHVAPRSGIQTTLT